MQFIDLEVINSKEINDLNTWFNEFKEFIQKARRIAQQYNSKPIPKTGNLKPLRKLMNKRFDNIAAQLLRVTDDFADDSVEQLFKTIAKAMALFSVSHFINIENLQSIQWNNDGSINLPEIPNLLEHNQTQITNDVSFMNGELLKLLGSPNMSGKTFYLLSALTAILFGEATGFASAKKEASMTHIQKVAFLNRTTTRSDPSLSSFGEEIKLIKQLLKETSNHQNTISIIDELGSSTSPKYQEAIYFAVAVYLLQKGQHAIFASHSHKTTQTIHEMFPDLAKTYHFGCTTNNQSTPMVFSHKLKVGDAKSEAIAVAEMLGLEPEIIKIARSQQ